MYEGVVQELIDELGRLPGVGPKSAQRIAFYLLQTEDDLAETVAFLVSPAAGKISGQIIAIDGNTERMV